jgi:hypothetical protein
MNNAWLLTIVVSWSAALESGLGGHPDVHHTSLFVHAFYMSVLLKSSYYYNFNIVEGVHIKT